MDVYSVWGSEDEGHRFPYSDNIFQSLDSARECAKANGAKNQIEFTDDLIEYVAVPPMGDVIEMYSYNNKIKSIDDALDCLRDRDMENLYAIDWVFIVKHTIIP